MRHTALSRHGERIATGSSLSRGARELSGSRVPMRTSIPAVARAATLD
jgi:hypothetical protein